MASRFPFEEDRRWRLAILSDPLRRYIYIGKDACTGHEEPTQVPRTINKRSDERLCHHDRPEQPAKEYDEFGALKARTIDLRRN